MTTTRKTEKDKKLVRATTEEQRADLKQATRASLRIVRGAKFSLVTRYQPEELSNFGTERADTVNKFMPVDVLADLQAELPRGVASPLLEELAAQAGLRLVPIDEDGEEAIDLDDVGQMMKEDGEGHAASLKVIVSPNCLPTIREARREINESLATTTQAARKLAQQERRILSRAN